MDRKDVYKVIDGERTYQNVKGELYNWRPIHSVGDYIVFMQGYLNAAIARGSKDSGWDSALEELRKVVALGIACFEQNGVPERKRTDDKDPRMI